MKELQTVAIEAIEREAADIIELLTNRLDNLVDSIERTAVRIKIQETKDRARALIARIEEGIKVVDHEGHHIEHPLLVNFFE